MDYFGKKNSKQGRNVNVKKIKIDGIKSDQSNNLKI